jgi:hypothetical protein
MLNPPYVRANKRMSSRLVLRKKAFWEKIQKNGIMTKR